MKKKAHVTKLSLDRETLHKLQDSALTDAAGGATNSRFICTEYSVCTPCIDP